MSAQLKAIQKILIQQSSKAALDANNKFVPGCKKVYGVRNPVLNELAKQFKEGGFDLVKELWDAGAYEEKITALKMLGYIAKKDPGRSLQLIQHFAKGIDNWAECDTMGMQSLKPLVKTHQEEIIALAKKCNISKDMWQRRLSLVLVEYYTRFPALLPEINLLVKALDGDEEYYVKKAIVWIKKNIAKGK
ncbi:MAG: DNA alkylation repair protein [Bacteroidota bacterium]